MLCLPWQLRQSGPSGSPWFFSLPWMLVMKTSTTPAWQMAQSTREGTVSQGRSWLGVAPVWHWMQRTFWWAESTSSAWSTAMLSPSRPGIWLTRSGLLWQTRQSLSLMPSS